MPKTRVAPRPTTDVDHDVPTWDALVAELGDPRPYEPTTIGHVAVDDAPTVDGDAYAAALTGIRDVVDDAIAAFDALTSAATDAFDALYRWPPSTARVVASVPALAQLDVESTVVLPAWPTLTVPDETDGGESR